MTAIRYQKPKMMKKYHKLCMTLTLILCLAFGLVIGFFPRPVMAAQADFEAYLEISENSLDEDGQLVVDVYLASDHALAPSAAQVDFSYQGLILSEAKTDLENGMASGDAGLARVSFMINQENFDDSGDLHMGTFTFRSDPASKGDAGLAISYAVAVVDSAEASVIYDISQLVVMEAGKSVEGNGGKNRTGRLKDQDYSSLRQTDGSKVTGDGQADSGQMPENSNGGQTDGQADGTGSKESADASGKEAERADPADPASQADTSAGQEVPGQGAGSQDVKRKAGRPAGSYTGLVIVIVAVVILAAAAAVLYQRKQKKKKNEP